MGDSLTEIVVERLYRSKEYLVERDLPIVGKGKAQFWSDLDILAIKEEVHLVNCKDFVTDPSQKERIRDNLDEAAQFIAARYSSLIGGKTIARRFVYMGCDKKTLDFLRGCEIDCKPLDEVLAEYLGQLEGFADSLNRGEASNKYAPPKGMRWYRVGNLRGYDKLLLWLLNKGFIQTKDGKIRRWE